MRTGKELEQAQMASLAGYLVASDALDANLSARFREFALEYMEALRPTFGHIRVRFGASDKWPITVTAERELEAKNVEGRASVLDIQNWMSTIASDALVVARLGDDALVETTCHRLSHRDQSFKDRWPDFGYELYDLLLGFDNLLEKWHLVLEGQDIESPPGRDVGADANA